MTMGLFQLCTIDLMKANIHLQIYSWMFLKIKLEIIENENIQFIHPNDFGKKINQDKQERKVLLTIDDGLLSFYQNAWPILRDKKNSFHIVCKY